VQVSHLVQRKKGDHSGFRTGIQTQARIWKKRSKKRRNFEAKKSVVEGKFVLADHSGDRRI